MATMTQETETYLSHFARLEKELAGRGPSSLLPLRRLAMARFTELGFPTTKHEEWKYTSVAPITRTPFEPAGRTPGERLGLRLGPAAHNLNPNPNLPPEH